MSAAIAPAGTQTLLTADEFARRHGGDHVELIDGVVKELPLPFQEHGMISNWAAFYLSQHAVANDLGRVTINDSFVQTQWNPDRVRGADVCYFSYQRLPKGPMPKGLFPIAPDLVIEVRSPSEGWNDMLKKVSEYLTAGISVVLVIDPPTQSATAYRKDEIQQIFDNGDELTIPDVLPGFAVPVRKFFE
jgi:Uma2 family endonuclease